MTIRLNTDLGRHAETDLATITATSNFILFHAGHRKLGMSNRNRDNLSLGESRKRVQEIIAGNLSKAGWSWGCVSAIDSNGRTIWIADAHRDDSQRFVVRADEILTAFVELEAAIRESGLRNESERPVGLRFGGCKWQTIPPSL
jgi:hypothetical protein